MHLNFSIQNEDEMIIVIYNNWLLANDIFKKKVELVAKPACPAIFQILYCIIFFNFLPLKGLTLVNCFIILL